MRFRGEQFHGGGGVEFDGVGNNLSRALTGSSFVLLLVWIDLCERQRLRVFSLCRLREKQEKKRKEKWKCPRFFFCFKGKCLKRQIGKESAKARAVG